MGCQRLSPNLSSLPPSSPQLLMPFLSTCSAVVLTLISPLTCGVPLQPSEEILLPTSAPSCPVLRESRGFLYIQSRPPNSARAQTSTPCLLPLTLCCQNVLLVSLSGLRLGLSLGAHVFRSIRAQATGSCFCDRITDRSIFEEAGFTLAYSSENTVHRVKEPQQLRWLGLCDGFHFSAPCLGQSSLYSSSPACAPPCHSEVSTN